jgi:hypothetical protein
MGNVSLIRGQGGRNVAEVKEKSRAIPLLPGLDLYDLFWGENDLLHGTGSGAPQNGE